MNEELPPGSIIRTPGPIQFLTESMSLRDWFAGMALSASIAQIELALVKGDRTDSTERTLRMLARDCYRAADAMLSEKEADARQHRDT